MTNHPDLSPPGAAEPPSLPEVPVREIWYNPQRQRGLPTLAAGHAAWIEDYACGSEVQGDDRRVIMRTDPDPGLLAFPELTEAAIEAVVGAFYAKDRKSVV